jgi:hypothetical protein
MVIQLSRIPVLSLLKSSRDDSKSLAAGAIAGITIGALSVVLLAILVACVRRARRIRRASESALAPESYIIVNPAQSQVSNPVSISTLPSAPSHSRASTPTVAQNRQEYLTAQLRTVKKQLETLQASVGTKVGTGGGHLEQAMPGVCGTLIYQKSSDCRSVMIYQRLYSAVSMMHQFPIKSRPRVTPCAPPKLGAHRSPA